MTIGIPEAIAGAGVLTALLSLALNRRQGREFRREIVKLRGEMARGDRDCSEQISRLGETLETSKRNAQASLELLRDGRLSLPARARAFRMLRSGMAAETAATELGMARNDVRLLEKIAGVLAPRN